MKIETVFLGSTVKIVMPPRMPVKLSASADLELLEVCS